MIDCPVAAQFSLRDRCRLNRNGSGFEEVNPMRSRTLQFAVCVLVAGLAGACSSANDSTDFAECRTAGTKAFKAAFQSTVSMPAVRWVQACMEKRGYKRVYDAGDCSKIEASLEEPGCYVKG
jgi:hypothetical protein